MSQFHAYANPSMGSVMSLFEGVGINNEAQSLSRQGRHKEALELFKEALRLKIESFGKFSVQAALSFNALGECYLSLQEYDLARENLEHALAFRKTQGETLDTRITRDNLGRVCEELGDKEGSKEHRKNGTNLCSNMKCPTDYYPPKGKSLMTCSRCRAIYYCSPNCQKVDWPRHKKYC